MVCTTPSQGLRQPTKANDTATPRQGRSSITIASCLRGRNSVTAIMRTHLIFSGIKVTKFYFHILVVLKPLLMPNYQEITKEYVDKIRLSYPINHISFDDPDDNKEIVPIQLTHDVLLNSFPVEDSIRDYYFSPTVVTANEEELREILLSGYGGQIHRYFYPYSVQIFGAYFSRLDLYNKLRTFVPKSGLYDSRFGITDLGGLIPYFKSYAIGFENGYKKFEKKCIRPYLTLGNDKEDVAFKVFQFVTTRNVVGVWWKSTKYGFNTTRSGNNPPEITGAYEDGQEHGYFYKAWSIIFSSHQNFARLFDEEERLSTNTQANNVDENTNHKNTLWFQIGLLFATGEMKVLLANHENNATHIAKNLGNRNLRPYITESVSKTNANDKNIFSSRKKMLYIIDYCDKSGIEVTDEFRGTLPLD